MGEKLKMNRVKKIQIAFLFIIFSTIFCPIYLEADTIEPFFSINILAPTTSTARMQHVTLFYEQLSKIGIEVGVFDHTGWAQISPRTWGYPGPYPIPTYDEGGYDVLFVGWSWGLDWNPLGLYDTASITPNGDNFYQYSNEEMDYAIYKLNNTYTLTDRIKWCVKIQSLLYSDLPEICFFYPVSVYPHNPNFGGWSGLLWASDYQPMVDWYISGSKIFRYATPADFEDFHPFTYESVYDAQWLSQIYNGLLERDSALQNGYNSWLASEVTTADGLTYNVKINADAKWADGTALTTDDVIYNYQLAVSPVLGSGKYRSNINFWNNNSIVKISDKEFNITFLQKYAFQDANLAINLLPKHIWESIDPADHQITAVNWAKNNPEKLFGAGPYKLEEYNYVTGIIHLTKNPYFKDWYGKDPGFDDVYFTFYSNKEGALEALSKGYIDMIDAQFSPQLSEIEEYNLNCTIVDDPGIQEMAINQFHPILGTGVACPIASRESAQHVRKALSHIIPRTVICSEIFDGLAKPGITGCPSVAIGFDKSLPPYAYDIDLALYHLGEAGYDVDEWLNGVPGSYLVGGGFIVLISIFGLVGGCSFLIIRYRKLKAHQRL